MKFTLVREDFRKDGIFSRLEDEDGNKLYSVCEHAYLQDDGSYAPKITNGTHACVRGKHRLNGMTQDFETFEITGVPGHVNLLFHCGNYNEDSEGCCLVGDKKLLPPAVNRAMVTDSKDSFNKFMKQTINLNNFELEVR